MFRRALRVAFTCGLFFAAAAPACSGSSSNSDDQSGANGGAGAGGSSHGRAGRNSGPGKAGSTGTPAAVRCGNAMCEGVTIPLAQLEAAGCCADAMTNTCGIDTSALPAMASGQGLPACQPVLPAGKPDATCASSPAILAMGVPVVAPGCCTPSGVCGYDLNRVGGFISLGLGCVDSTPFADAGRPVICGASGDGGMGGAASPQPGGDGGMSGSAGSGAPGN